MCLNYIILIYPILLFYLIMPTLLEQLFPKKTVRIIPTIPTHFRIFTYRYAGSIYTPLLKDWQVLFHKYDYDNQGYIRGVFIIHNYTTVPQIQYTFFLNNPAFEVWGAATDIPIVSENYFSFYRDFIYSNIPDNFDIPLSSDFLSIDSFDWDIDNETVF